MDPRIQYFTGEGPAALETKLQGSCCVIPGPLDVFHGYGRYTHVRQLLKHRLPGLTLLLRRSGDVGQHGPRIALQPGHRGHRVGQRTNLPKLLEQCAR